MARTKNRPPAPTAAHAAPDPAPAPGTAPAPGSPAAAVCAALSANPGATTAVIASAAGTGKPAARDALLAMEAAGTATRVKGGKPGIPDTWTPAEPAPLGADPAPEDEPDAQPGGSPDGAAKDKTADDTGQDDTAEPANPTPEDDEVRAVPDGGAPQDPGPGDTAEQDTAADSNGESGDARDPGLVMQIAEHITQIKAAADAAAITLAGGGDLHGALAGLDEIAEQAALARRSLKAATGGRKTPAARPGGLRDKVLAHLDQHPGTEFTPHEIHKVLTHSSGAIANALDTLVKLGEAELASEKPRRFRRAAKPAPPVPGANSAKDGTELAGAA